MNFCVCEAALHFLTHGASSAPSLCSFLPAARPQEPLAEKRQLPPEAQYLMAVG